MHQGPFRRFFQIRRCHRPRDLAALKQSPLNAALHLQVASGRFSPITGMMEPTEPTIRGRPDDDGVREEGRRCVLAGDLGDRDGCVRDNRNRPACF